jgi:hypothetical protein
VLVLGVLSAYPLSVYADKEIIVSVIAGCVVSVLNALAGYVSIEYAFDKPNAVFLKIVLGGMGIRLVALGIIVVLLIKVFHLHLFGLIASLFAFYFIFVVAEIVFLNKKMSLKKSH